MDVEQQLTVAETASPAIEALNGRWRNRLGSVMELHLHADDSISGTFHTGVGVPHPERAFALTGYAVGDALAFCVDFRPQGSVASWAGHHVVDEHGERLVTLWHLARPVRAPHSDADVWQGLLAGANEFVRDTSS